MKLLIIQGFIGDRMRQEADMSDVFGALHSLNPNIAREIVKEMHTMFTPDFALDEFAISYRECAKEFPDTPVREVLRVGPRSSLLRYNLSN